ncbi:hypothetical protein J3B01_003276 [Coemansia erecta]|nr:hypothetical protein J3B01_003276 [Coemansia erecta]
MNYNNYNNEQHGYPGSNAGPQYGQGAYPEQQYAQQDQYRQDGYSQNQGYPQNQGHPSQYGQDQSQYGYDQYANQANQSHPEQNVYHEQPPYDNNGYPADKHQYNGEYGRDDEAHRSGDEEDYSGERGLEKPFMKTTIDQYGNEHQEFSKGRTTAVLGGAALALFAAKKGYDYYKGNREAKRQDDAMMAFQSNNTLYDADGKPNHAPSNYGPYNSQPPNQPY